MTGISSVIEKELCCSCRACGAICSSDAISFDFFKDPGMFYPRIDAGVCVHCGKCASVCPSIDIVDAPIDGKRTLVKVHPIASYVAYALDFEVRWNSASGGVVSSLVKELLDTNEYQRAYVVVYDRFDGTQVTRTCTS